jgi:hypothetical protein
LENQDTRRYEELQEEQEVTKAMVNRIKKGPKRQGKHAKTKERMAIVWSRECSALHSWDSNTFNAETYGLISSGNKFAELRVRITPTIKTKGGFSG